MKSKLSIMVVDDEPDFLSSVKRMLRLEGFRNIHSFERPTLALEKVKEEQIHVAFLDITMPEMDGLELLEEIKAHSPHTECIMVTAHESAPLVVKALRRGAYDYLVKPLTPQIMKHSLTRALERHRLLTALQIRKQEELEHPEAFEDIITITPDMLKLLHEAELHASSDIPVLVTGETGVGKELLAQAIHRTSLRANGPFVAMNLLSISPALFESTFFGHVKGAFTGAEQASPGLLGQATGGTLFLDEIGDLPMELQGKLLRVLQEKEYNQVGGLQTKKADVRIIAATHQDLQRLVRQHKFRKDLLYRLQFAHLHIPPLRQRQDDLPLLAGHILSHSARPNVSLSNRAQQILRAYHWPGNVRELKGVLEAAANLATEESIEAQHLRLPSSTAKTVAPVGEQVLQPLAEVERLHILRVYEAMSNNKTQTARMLGIGLQTLHRKLKSYGVS